MRKPKNTVKIEKMLSSQHYIAEMGDRLATIDKGQKVGGLLSAFFGEAIGEDRKPKQLQGTSTDVELPGIAFLCKR